MDKYIPLFSKDFILSSSANFDLSSVAKISKIMLLIRNWTDSLESGKLINFKEESIKSRFLMEFFGEILGFSYQGSDNWLFQEEVKTDVDSTKPDGALGYFYITEKGIKKDVRIVIELKSALVELDKIQEDRRTKISPVDQAMLYASKTENCKWVVVTNMREIRFYQANDQIHYQKYLLSDLNKEDHLQELLFLFHRERFFSQKESSTEGLLKIFKKEQVKEATSSHILDQLYFSLKKFDNLPFVDPNIIANMKPFNVLDEYVWHYSDGHLLSINPEIYKLLSAIKIENNKVIYDDLYEKELLQNNVIEYNKKGDYVINKLNNSNVKHFSALKDIEKEKASNSHALGFSERHIMNLTADNSMTLNIQPTSNEICDCIICSYYSLDFVKLIQKVEKLEDATGSENLELAYGHYLLCTDDFKRSFQIYKKTLQATQDDEKRIFEYFCSKYNLKSLHNLFFYDSKYDQLRKESNLIDLDYVVSNELDVFLDQQTRNAMLKIKEANLFQKALKRSGELLTVLKNIQTNAAKGDRYQSLPNYANQLCHEFEMVFNHTHNNLLIHDKFNDYSEFVTNVFNGLLVSMNTYDYGINGIGSLILIEAILHLKPKVLYELLDTNKKLQIIPNERIKFLKVATTYFNSYVQEGLWGSPYINKIIEKQMINAHFKDMYKNIFSNLCIILSIQDYEAEEFNNIGQALIKFIKVDGALNWWDMKYFANLVERKGMLFSANQLSELLVFSLENHQLYKSNKYEDLIRQISNGLKHFHPNFTFENIRITKKAIINCESDGGRRNLKPLIPLWDIANDEVKTILTRAFEEYLDHHFDANLYDDLLKMGVIKYNRKDYLFCYAKFVTNRAGNGFTGFKNGLPQFDDYTKYNFLLIPYILDLDFNLSEIKQFQNLSKFEMWFSNPFDFDYNDFEARWLLAANNVYVIKKLAGFSPLIEKIEESLKSNFDPELSEIYFLLLK